MIVLNAKAKKPKSIKKIVVLMSIALTLLMVVNNIFKVLNSDIETLRNVIGARQVYINLTQEQYDEMGDELLSVINSSLNRHIEDSYFMYYADVEQEDGEEIKVSNISSAELARYGDVSSDYQIKDDEIFVGKYDVLFDGSIEEKKESDYIGKVIKETVRRERYRFTSPEQMTPEIEVIEEKEYSFRIAGFYDNIRANAIENYAYVSQRMAEELSSIDTVEDAEDSVSSVSPKVYAALIAVIDDYDNAQDVIDSINEKLEQYEKYSLSASGAEYTFSDEYVGLGAIQLFANFAVSFVMVCTAISIYSYINDTMNRRRCEFGIMKAIGYRTSALSKMLFVETLPEIIIPLAMAFAGGFISVEAIKVYSEARMTGFEMAITDFVIFPDVAALVAAAGVLLPLAGYIFMVAKLKKLEPMEALRAK